MASVFIVGTRHEVRWRDTSREADILQIRLLASKVVLNSEQNTTTNEENIPDKDKEYYVHFVGYDKRLDEWITVDRFVQPDPNMWTDKPGSVTRVDKHAERELHGMKELESEDDDFIDVEKLDLDDTKSSTHGLKANNGVAHSVSVNGYGHYHDDEERQREEEEDSEHPTASNVRNIEQVIFGSYLIDTWYYSPYAEEYSRLQRLYVCELCFKYMKRPTNYIRHQNECTMRQPPGQLIYKNGNIKVYEVDGHHDKLYCQNLCLFAKFFLDQKTVFYDVAPFLFYVMAITSSENGHSVQRVVAYFSKEKQSIENYNLACITTFPPYQKKGFGRFLIELSYELSKLEHTVGHPEKPLSDLGLRGYESFWITAILRALLEWKVDDLSEHDSDSDTNDAVASSMEVDETHTPANIKNISGDTQSSEQHATVSIVALSRDTGIRTEDVVYTLELLGLLPPEQVDTDDSSTKKTQTEMDSSLAKTTVTSNNNNNSNNHYSSNSNSNHNFVITVTHEHLQSLVQKYNIVLDRAVDPTKITWHLPNE